MKISGYSNSKVFDMAHFEVRGKGHFEVRGKLPPCAIHDWSAVEDCPRPEAGSAPNVRQYNSGACICWSQICMKHAKIQCMLKAPFFWATINSPSEVDLWRQRRKMHVVQVFHTRTEPHTFAGFTVFGKHCECNAHKFTHLKRLPPLGSHLLLLSHCVLTPEEGQKIKYVWITGDRTANTGPQSRHGTHYTNCIFEARGIFVFFLSSADILNYKLQLVLRTEKFS